MTHTKSPVIQQQDYYSFGLNFNSYSKENSLAQNFGFSDKEIQVNLGLGWLDFGARNYLPELGRWTSIDPFTERMANFSAYSYSFNNPILFIDPTGMLPTYNWGSSNYENEDGEIISWQEAYASIKSNQGGPKTRNAMVFMNNGRQLLAMVNDNKSNKNWHYYNASDMQDAGDHVTSYSSEVGKLLNLVIRSHGTVASIGLGMSEGSTSCASGTCFNRNDASGMQGDFPMNEGDMASFNAMKAFASAMADGGSLIFTACQAGYFEGELGVRLNDLFKKAGLSVNFNMYMNAHLSNMTTPVTTTRNGVSTRKEHILNYPLSDGTDWFKISPNGSSTAIKKSIQLNSSGAPVTFVNSN